MPGLSSAGVLHSCRNVTTGWTRAARVRDRVYQRLYEILNGKDQSATYARLSAEDRKAILEILRDTKPNLPAYWKE